MPAQPPADVVVLSVPATGLYAAVVRTTAAALAARVDFTIDDIEDLRIAIGEAIALGIEATQPATESTHLTCTFALAVGAITVTITAPTSVEHRVDTESFAWQVLDTLADHVQASASQDEFSISFAASSQAAPRRAGAGL